MCFVRIDVNRYVVLLALLGEQGCKQLRVHSGELQER